VKEGEKALIIAREKRNETRERRSGQKKQNMSQIIISPVLY